MPRKARTAHVGVDVSKDVLWVAWSGLDEAVVEFDLPNTTAGVGELLSRVTAGRIKECRIVVEATGPYSALVVAAAANHPKAQVMRIQPADGKHFAKLVTRAKTDRADARMLLQYAQRMTFRPTVLPSADSQRLRSLARHMSKVIDRRAAVKNQRHAKDIEDTDAIDWAIEAELTALNAIITQLEAQIDKALEEHSDERVAQAHARFHEIKGINTRSVARVLPELMGLPTTLTPRQVVAHCGLDPRPKQSGTARAGTSWNISKAGNARIRRVLYMCTLSAVQHDPAMRAFYNHLLAKGKPKKVAHVAAMRKLVVALWCVYARGEEYNPTKVTSRIAA